MCSQPVAKFSQSVAKPLAHYVYRLIDPRNGETFYVGRGSGNRIFAHARGVAAVKEEASSQKLQRIRQIRLDGFEVTHVIHRHGMDRRTAEEVEAALIDAYPGATNIAGGRQSRDRGVAHSKQIIERFEAPEATFSHRGILIKIPRSATKRDSIYDALRFAWKLSASRASRAQLVFAAEVGLIVDVFAPDCWKAATLANFPEFGLDRPGRLGFIGKQADAAILKQYVRHRLPLEHRKVGSANPVAYVGPWTTRARLAQTR